MDVCLGQAAAEQHTWIQFYGPERRRRTSTYLLRQLSGFFHTIVSLLTAPILTTWTPPPPPHPPLSPSSLSSLAWFSPCRLPFKPKGVCQVPNPLAKRSEADKETGDLLFYSRKAKKWNPHRPGHCILPPFLPELLFHSFNPALVLFLLCQTLAPPPSPLSPSYSTYGRPGGGGCGRRKLMSSFVAIRRDEPVASRSETGTRHV